jgi:hypothetical protein
MGSSQSSSSESEPSVPESKRVILIGAMGHGKSTSGNKILRGNYFTSGRSIGRVTESVQIKEANQIKIADCPGFGDKDAIFNYSYRTMKANLENMCPLHAIVLVIKFNDKESIQFLEVARSFLKYFGSPAIKSLVIACIQTGDIRYSDDEFKQILYANEGYKHLVSRNNNTHVHYLLWDNFDPYPNQHDTLVSKINSAAYYNRGMMDFLYHYIEQDLEERN